MSTPKIRSTRSPHGKDLSLRVSQVPLLLPLSASPSDPRLEVIGVFNPTFLRIRANRHLVVRVDERPIFNHLQEGNGIQDLRNLQVARARINQIGKIDIVDVKVPSSYDPNFEPFLPDSVRGNSTELVLSYLSHLRLATLNDSRIEISERPLIFPDSDLNRFGCEDPRATVLEGRNFITYTGISRYGATSWLAEVGDDTLLLQNRILLGPDHKHSVLLPKKIDRAYCMFCRPLTRLHVRHNGIWLLYSPNLIHWGQPKPVLFPREGSWDSDRVGPCMSPILTPSGWLLFYYGVDAQASYHVGAVLLQESDPMQIIGRSSQPILSPSLDWERTGRRADTVFPCGVELYEHDRSARLYYGAGDAAIGAADIAIPALLESLQERTGIA